MSRSEPTPLPQDALSPIESSLQSLAGNVNSFVQQQPDLRIPIPRGTQAESWLLTTYLDNVSKGACPQPGCTAVLVGAEHLGLHCVAFQERRPTIDALCRCHASPV